MKNKIRESKTFTIIIDFVQVVVYIYGSMKIADWVVNNIGKSPTSSFYGLVTLIILMFFIPNENLNIFNSSDNKEKNN